MGDLTDELEGYGLGSFIEKFVSGGPKFYAYRVRAVDDSTHDTCKLKGFQKTYENSLKINFNTIVDLVNKFNENKEEKITVNNLNFRRTEMHDVYIRKEEKTCSIVLKKRRFVGESESYPFGYKKTKRE